MSAIELRKISFQYNLYKLAVYLWRRQQNWERLTYWLQFKKSGKSKPLWFILLDYLNLHACLPFYFSLCAFISNKDIFTFVYVTAGVKQMLKGILRGLWAMSSLPSTLTVRLCANSLTKRCSEINHNLVSKDITVITCIFTKAICNVMYCTVRLCQIGCMLLEQ